MTLGNHWGCASTWHDVYYRVWRVDSTGAKLLIDDSEWAWLRSERFIVGSIGQLRETESGPITTPVDVLVEFTKGSIDPGVHNREAVRHYLITGDRVRRVAPVALSPRDFVDEWLTRPWSEAANWSAAGLQPWHRNFDKDFVGGEFGDTTMHCQTPDLWQVSVIPHDEKTFEDRPRVYFLVRWAPPYNFTMAAISDKPWPRCDKKDPEADAWRTLFNTQEWR